MKSLKQYLTEALSSEAKSFVDAAKKQVLDRHDNSAWVYPGTIAKAIKTMASQHKISEKEIYELEDAGILVIGQTNKGGSVFTSVKFNAKKLKAFNESAGTPDWIKKVDTAHLKTMMDILGKDYHKKNQNEKDLLLAIQKEYAVRKDKVNEAKEYSKELIAKLDDLTPSQKFYVAQHATGQRFPSGDKYFRSDKDNGLGRLLTILYRADVPETDLTKSFSRYIKEAKDDPNEIDSESEFRSYAETVLKNAHGDDYDESIASKMIDDLISEYGSDFGAMVGVLQNSLA